MKKTAQMILIRFSILNDFLGTLMKYKLWWAVPIIMLLLASLIFLLVAGSTGIAAFIYPLF